METNQKEVIDWVAQTMGASAVRAGQSLQTLWSGYGEIKRYHLSGASVSTVIVKQIQPPLDPEQSPHSRGWNSQRGHQRKLKSYQVEMHWYQSQDRYRGLASRLPLAYGCWQSQQQSLILLEDLDAAGFSQRCRQLDRESVRPGLLWLAAFHAHFLSHEILGDPELWAQGSYWHLQTRPDEWQQMPTGPLKQQAARIAQALQQGPQTLLHGDAKAANFCFRPDLQAVAGLDFQYLGKGCGMQDLAYFLRSCLPASRWEALIPDCLDVYFASLRQALIQQGAALDGLGLETQWRALFSVAWADFLRFLLGWQPGFEPADFRPFDQVMLEQALVWLD